MISGYISRMEALPLSKLLLPSFVFSRGFGFLAPLVCFARVPLFMYIQIIYIIYIYTQG